MFRKVSAVLAAFALVAAIPFAIGASANSSTPSAPCVCCGDSCVCEQCVCDDAGCACDTGGLCACDSECSASCCD